MLDFKTLSEIDGIDVKVICKDYLPIHHANYNLLAGNGGTGKSLIALKELCHFLQEFPNKKALAIFSEDTKSEILKRLIHITDSMRITKEEVLARTFFKTVDNDDGAVFCVKERNLIVDTEYLTDFKINLIKHNVGFVILDPLERFHTGLSENDESDMKHLMNVFLKIGVDSSCSILVLHHTPKGNSGGYRGSTVIANKGRIAYNIRKNTSHDKALGVEVVREGWEKSVVLSIIKDNHFAVQYCDIIQRQNGKLDLPVSSGIPKISNYNCEVITMPTITNDHIASDLITVSIADHNSEHNAIGFAKKEMEWSELPSSIMNGFAYAPAGFKNGHRHNDNYLLDTNVVFLDIDSGMSLVEAKELFSPLKCFIVTTRSHQKEKKGIVCDRFRVAIKLTNPITLAKGEYQKAMQAIFNFFGSVDRSTKDPARFYFSSPKECELWISDGTESLDWKPLYNIYIQAIANEELKRKNYQYSPQDATDEAIVEALNKIDPDCDYDTWYSIGMALKTHKGDLGFELWDSWSSRGRGYEEGEMINKWKSFNQAKKNIGTLFYYAKGL